MKLRRKFLQTLDIRVRQSLADYRPVSISHLHRVHSIESLAADHFSDRHSLPAGATETSTL